MPVRWLGLFPVPLAVVCTIELLPIDPPIPLKLPMETAIVVPLPNHVITPWVDDLFGDRLYAGIGTGERDGVDIGR